MEDCLFKLYISEDHFCLYDMSADGLNKQHKQKYCHLGIIDVMLLSPPIPALSFRICPHSDTNPGNDLEKVREWRQQGGLGEHSQNRIQ